MTARIFLKRLRSMVGESHETTELVSGIIEIQKGNKCIRVDVKRNRVDVNGITLEGTMHEVYLKAIKSRL